MQRRRPKELVLIDARAFVERLSTAALITDATGNLVFYNEAAEHLVGRPFSEAGEMPADKWPAMFTVRRLDGTSVGVGEMLGGRVIVEHRPAHGKLRFTALEGTEHTIEVTALPIFTGEKEPVGIIALFWPDSDGG